MTPVPPPASLEASNVVRVALVFDFSGRYQQKLADSLLNAPNRPQRVSIRAWDARTDFVPKMRLWNPQGIIAHLDIARQLQKTLKLGIPIVNIGDLQFLDVPTLDRDNLVSRVDVDDQSVGSVAAEYLLTTGARQFAVIHFKNVLVFETRARIFKEAIAIRGFPCETLAFHEREAESRIAAWIRRVPKPVAVFTPSDHFGALLLEVCLNAGFKIPEELLVLGVDNDDLACYATPVPMSSIPLPYDAMASQAWNMLLSRMKGQPAVGPVLLPASHAITRVSTDLKTDADPEVSAAVRFIQENKALKLSVAQVVDHVMISRRALQIRFRQTLGRSILQEIHRHRLDFVKELLANPSSKINSIAFAAGFANSTLLFTWFKDRTGKSPSRYRRDILRAGQESDNLPGTR